MEKRRKLDFPRKWRQPLNGMRGSYYREAEVAGVVEKVAILQLTKIYSNLLSKILRLTQAFSPFDTA